MRWRPPTSRVVALALLGLLGLAAVELITAPLLTAYPDVGLRIEQSQALLNRYRALSAQRPELSARLEAFKNAVADSIAHLEGGPSDALAGAALQNHVRSIVEGAGGVLRSSQIVPFKPTEPETSVRQVALKLQLRIGLDRLQNILYEIETTKPYIFIREITISREKAGELGGNAEENPLLELRMEVYGFLKDSRHRL